GLPAFGLVIVGQRRAGTPSRQAVTPGSIFLLVVAINRKAIFTGADVRGAGAWRRQRMPPGEDHDEDASVVFSNRVARGPRRRVCRRRRSGRGAAADPGAGGQSGTAGTAPGIAGGPARWRARLSADGQPARRPGTEPGTRARSGRAGAGRYAGTGPSR